MKEGETIDIPDEPLGEPDFESGMAEDN